MKEQPTDQVCPLTISKTKKVQVLPCVGPLCAWFVMTGESDKGPQGHCAVLEIALCMPGPGGV